LIAESVRRYVSSLRTFLKFLRKRGINPEEMDMQVLRFLRHAIYDRKAKHKTVENYFAVLSAFYDYLAFEGYVSSNIVLPFRRRQAQQNRNSLIPLNNFWLRNIIDRRRSKFMDVIKTTTLAMGASLIGSSLPMVLTKLDVLPLTIFIMGIIFLLHGTGLLQEHIVGGFLRWYRTKKPVIAIINDLPWSEYGHVWSRMEPKEWSSRINNIINEGQIDTKAKLIEITKPWTRWFLDRYSIILNPYGPKYPETDIENLTIMKSILHCVENGGMFVNVADIPFFFPYDKRRGVYTARQERRFLITINNYSVN
jgi:hypothetical protein